MDVAMSYLPATKYFVVGSYISTQLPLLLRLLQLLLRLKRLFKELSMPMVVVYDLDEDIE